MDVIARYIASPSATPTQLPPALIITGPRATGKTLLAQTLFPTHRHISLALPTEVAQAVLDPTVFLASLGRPVVIDDIQLAPRLVHHVAREVASRPCPPSSYVLVGSRPGAVLAAADEAFSGDVRRCRVLQVDGLSHAEIAAARPSIPLTSRLFRGGFPSLYADEAPDIGSFMRSIIASHLAHELPLQLRVDSIHDYERFLRSVAHRAGRLLNKADLAREIGIAGSTAAIWLDTLISAGIVTLVRPWRPSDSKPLVKAPKVYFRDTGLCASLLGIRDDADLAASPHAPMLWGTAVYGELRRLVAASSPQAEIIFWRDRTKGVDFLVPTRGGLVMVESSWSEYPSSATVARLLRIRDAIGPESVSRIAIVCRTPERQTLREPGGPLVETVGLDDLPGLVR